MKDAETHFRGASVVALSSEGAVESWWAAGMVCLLVRVSRDRMAEPFEDHSESTVQLHYADCLPPPHLPIALF